MTTYYAAVDIGASSGRLMLGWLEEGKMQLEEVHRFENGMVKQDGILCWEFDRLFDEICKGLQTCREIGKTPSYLGVDTWGVDFVLLDQADQVIGHTVGYRDGRTEGMDEVVYQQIPREELYTRTGIQRAIYNTIFQLMALREQHPEELDAAETLLFVPDYFHYLLTGKKTNEYTEATTSGMISAATNDWDWELIDQLGYPRRIFRDLILPGMEVGRLRPELVEKIGYDLTVVAPCTHDTGSAVLAVPGEGEDFVYISSGTWSLMGVEAQAPVCTQTAYAYNLTNEGGYAYRFRLLKNIMGLWMIQSVRHEMGDAYSFSEICDAAEAAADFPSRVDCNADRFLAPENMTEAVREACRESGQPVPETLGEIATVIYTSLAECYARTIQELEETTGRTFHKIHVVGGGSHAAYLNALTAKATGMPVYCGPGEATAIGNLAAQMLHTGTFSDLVQARQVIRDSFPMTIYGENADGGEG